MKNQIIWQKYVPIVKINFCSVRKLQTGLHCLKSCRGTGEVTWWLKVNTALAEDRSSVSSTHIDSSQRL